jgi:hypothetical protein
MFHLHFVHSRSADKSFARTTRKEATGTAHSPLHQQSNNLPEQPHTEPPVQRNTQPFTSAAQYPN